MRERGDGGDGEDGGDGGNGSTRRNGGTERSYVVAPLLRFSVLIRFLRVLCYLGVGLGIFWSAIAARYAKLAITTAASRMSAGFRRSIVSMLV